MAGRRPRVVGRLVVEEVSFFNEELCDDQRIGYQHSSQLSQ